MGMSIGRLGGAALLALAVALPAGCSRRISLLHYPDFYDPQIKTVAVVEFDNDSLQSNAGMFVATRLADALSANGTYGVIGPRELAAQLERASVAMPTGRRPDDLAPLIARLPHVDAFITGSVRSLSAERTVYVTRPYGYVTSGYGWGRHGHGSFSGAGLGMTYPFRRYDISTAQAAGAARLTRAGGQQIAATGPLEVYVDDKDVGPGGAEEALHEAARGLARLIVAHLAVVEVEVKIRNPGKVLRTARAGGDGTLDYTDDFRPSDSEIVVVLCLPAEADRNALRLTVSRKGSSQPLQEHSFTWEGGNTCRRFTFEVDRLGGPGDYDLILHRDGRGIWKSDFEIGR